MMPLQSLERLVQKEIFRKCKDIRNNRGTITIELPENDVTWTDVAKAHLVAEVASLLEKENKIRVWRLRVNWLTNSKIEVSWDGMSILWSV